MLVFPWRFAYYAHFSGGVKKMSENIYKILFMNQEQVFEMFVRHIFQSDIYGFIEVEEYLFNERSQMIVDPSEEKLKTLFGGVKRSFIPMHAIIRIDEVEQLGTVKITEGKGGASNVHAFAPVAPSKKP